MLKFVCVFISVQCFIKFWNEAVEYFVLYTLNIDVISNEAFVRSGKTLLNRS